MQIEGHEQEWLSWIVTSHNTHVTLLTNLSQFLTCHIPCHSPCASSTLELISPWSTAITASHQLPRSPEFSSTLKLRYHQYCPQYFCLKFSPSSSYCSYSCSCSCPMFWHRIPVFLSIFRYVPIPNGYALWLVYIDPHLVLYSICSNIDFDYCSHCLLDLWSLPTSIRLP